MGERGQRGAAFRVDEVLLHFRTLVGSLGHARILLYGQALQGRFASLRSAFFRNRDGHRCRGVRTPGPAAAAAALESAAHLHYVDYLQSSLVSIPVFPVLYCRFSFLLLFRCSFRNVTRYSAHMKIARTHCTSAFERFFRRNQPYQYVLSDSRNMRWQSQYRYRIRIDIA